MVHAVRCKFNKSRPKKRGGGGYSTSPVVNEGSALCVHLPVNDVALSDSESAMKNLLAEL